MPLRVIAAVLAMLAVLPAIGRSQAAERYVVGVENISYLPAYGVIDGEYGGFARAVLDAFARDNDIEFVYRPLPVQRLFATFLDGGADFKFPDNPSWAQKEKSAHDVVYSAPVMAYLDATVVRPENAGATVQEIRSLGTVTGFTVPPGWEERASKGAVRIVENGDFDALVRQVLSGRVDAGFASIAVVNERLDGKIGRPGGLVAAPNLPSARGEYFLSTIAHADVLDRFNRWLAEHADEVRALKEQYGVEKGVGR